MRILVLIHEFPPIGGGGGRAAQDICERLVLRGHEVAVLTAHMDGTPFRENRDGLQVIRVSSFRTQPFAASFRAMSAYIFAGLWAGLRFIRDSRPDIIHAHFAVPAGALAFMLSLLTRVPYIVTAHLGDVPKGVPEKTDRWFRWLFPLTHPVWKYARAIVAVSEHTRQLALERYPVEVKVIHNGAEIKESLPSEIKVNNPPRIIFAGRLVSQKNPLAIVRVMSHLKDLDWNFIMLGDGPLLDDVKREIEKNGMTGRFDIKGWVTPEDVLENFSHSDILFMPSLSEGLPVVGVQALAKGLAIVASRIGGFMDLVDDGQNGFLFDIHDHDGFTSALRSLISDPSLLSQYRRASLEKAGAFDIDKIAAQYESLLENVIGGH